MLNKVKRKQIFLKGLWPQQETKTFHTSGFSLQYEDASMLILTKRKDGESCVVSFSGVGHGTGGIDLQKPEFMSGGSLGSQVFVIDKRRSWGNQIDWERLRDIVSLFCDGQNIVCIGNSMGGFLALLGSRYLNASHVAAFAPQWSVDPRIVPNEHRWDKYVDNIDVFVHSDLRKSFVSNTKYTVVFGGDPDDSEQRNLFFKFTNPAADGNILLLTIPGAGHNVAKYLKEKGVLPSIISQGLTAGLHNFELAGLQSDFDLSFRRTVM